VRLRTTGGNDDGWPYLRQEDAVSDGVEHYAMTLTGGVLSLYRNGQLVKSEPREGDLSNWDPSYPLLVGNERTGDRSWRGEVYLLAIYDRALSGAEINRNYQVGDNLAGGGNPVVNQPPEVGAGRDRTVLLPATSAQLQGAVADDGLPADNVTVEWSKASGPGTVTFSPTGQTATTATFSAEGEYVLTLTANDGALPASDSVTVTVASSSRVSQDLVAFYPLNEGEGGIAHDQSGFEQPLDMEMNSKTSWLAGRNGVLLEKEGKLVSAAAGKVHQAITGSGEFSFEVWAKAGNLTQGGPARLVSYSADSSNRNFTLGQQAERAEVRFRTSESESGWPYMRLEGLFSENTDHYVVTYGNSLLSLYKNGQLVEAQPRAGDLSNWNPAYPLLIGNEVTNWRSWRGEVYMMAVYSRALGAAEIQRNFLAGDNLAGGGNLVANQPPEVDAGDDRTVLVPTTSTTVHGAAADDGLPSGSLTVEWSKASGPGDVTFSASSELTTMATFSAPGEYVLTLSAADGEKTSTDDVTVMVTESARVSQNLIAYYPLNEGHGTVAHDQSGFQQPLDIELNEKTSWVAGRNGILFEKYGRAASAAAGKVHQAITSSGEFTFEVWANPADLKQWGPARVVSYSWDRHQRNFTLGQQAARAEVRLRTTEGNDDGWPYLREEEAFSENLEHYTVTFASRLLSFYRNGQLVKAEPREGDLSNWNPDYPLLIGNE
ncbi:MAG: PKD domain-containing protein, partial [bacterium]|nr:PKD domain-containing protein [bacterium]